MRIRIFWAISCGVLCQGVWILFHVQNVRGTAYKSIRFGSVQCFAQNRTITTQKKSGTTWSTALHLIFYTHTHNEQTGTHTSTHTSTHSHTGTHITAKKKAPNHINNNNNNNTITTPTTFRTTPTLTLPFPFPLPLRNNNANNNTSKQTQCTYRSFSVFRFPFSHFVLLFFFPFVDIPFVFLQFPYWILNFLIRENFRFFEFIYLNTQNPHKPSAHKQQQKKKTQCRRRFERRRCFRFRFFASLLQQQRKQQHKQTNAMYVPFFFRFPLSVFPFRFIVFFSFC